MKILIVSNNTDRASFRQRIALYVDYLKIGGIDCEIAELPPGILPRRQIFMRAANFDCVFLHKKTLNPFDAYYLGKYANKVIYDFDDAVMYDNDHPGKNHRKRQSSFRRTIRLANMVIAGNEYLAAHARKFNTNVEILPTGLDMTVYQISRPARTDDKIRLVWIGSKSTLPYLKQISPALEEIGKRFNNVVLRIICDEFFELQNMKVEKCPWAQQTEAANLVSSDIGLAPLPDNPFTRGKCGYKILQYQAAGLPVIASPVGVNTELVRDGINGYHAVTDWVEKISALVTNKRIGTLMSWADGQTVQLFDSRVIAKQLIMLIKGTIDGPQNYQADP